jgi:hypothetical protein
LHHPWMDLNGGAESPMKSSWTNIENAQAQLIDLVAFLQSKYELLPEPVLVP